VREDDADPELLEEESTMLRDGEMVAMAVKDSPLLWRTFAADRVTLSEAGAVATHTLDETEGFDDDSDEQRDSLTTTGIELTEGKHYWEIELISKAVSMIFIGISRPNLDPRAFHGAPDNTGGWCMCADDAALWGNGKAGHDEAGENYQRYDTGVSYKQGDGVGVLLGLDSGSPRFFKNGVVHGPGYPAGSVTGPVVHAVQMFSRDDSVRLLPDAKAPVSS
jgi:hypothetical protein